MHKICDVTATRAEYGLLRPLLFRISSNRSLKLQLVVTGTHLYEKFGNTQKEIIADGFSDFTRVVLPLEDDSKKGMAIAAGVATQRFGDIFEELQPDLVVILGDRYEMLGVAIAAHLMGVPIAHLCGGDVTEGAVDDAIRHCITKLSYLHFPGCEQSANRIIQMGEDPERVFNVGEPGIENCLNIELISRETLAIQIGFRSIESDYCIVTFHPVTMENNTAEKQVYELIKAMNHFVHMSYIITKSNADAGGRIINKIWDMEGKKHSNWLVADSLGVVNYLSAVKYAKLVIGNSSSGLVEVPAFRVPTINIGNRQKGRMMAKSVISCIPESTEIVKAMNKGLSDQYKAIFDDMMLPFGDGHTSELVEKHIIAFLSKHNSNTEKHFYDVEFIEGNNK